MQISLSNALALCGDPVESEETDGVAESDDWLKGELQVSCAYADDQSIANVCVMPPYKG
jgi:hypothetical protein